MLPPYLRGKVYYCDLGRIAGKRKIVSLRTSDLREATRLWEELVGERRREMLGFEPRIAKKQGSAPTIASLRDGYLTDLKTSARPATVNLAKRIIDKLLVPELGAIEARALSDAEVRTFIEKRQKAGITNSTISRDLDILRRLLRHFDFSAGVIPRLPNNRAPIARAVSDGEVSAVLDTGDSRLRLFLMLAREAGLRFDEARCLPLAALVLDGDPHVRIEDDRSIGFQPKGGDARIVPLTSGIVEAARAWLKVRPDKQSRYLFPGDVRERDRPISGPRIRETFINARKRAGVRFRVHDARHALASELVRADVHPRKLQKLFGWKTTKMIEVYEHLDAEDLRSDIEAGALGRRKSK